MNSLLVSDAVGRGGRHLRWALRDPSALSLPASPLSDRTWTDFCKSSLPIGSLLYYQSFQAPNFIADFNPVQSGTGFQTNKQTNKINKQEPLLSLQCFQVHKSLITFLVNVEGGFQHMDCEWKCVTWNLVLC